MRAFSRWVTAVALIASAATATAQSTSTSTALTAEEWRRQYEDGLRAEYGWLSVAGLTFLPIGSYTIGSDPGSDVVLPAGHAPTRVGRLVVTDAGVTLHVEPDVAALLNGEPAGAVVTLNKVRPAAPGAVAAPADRVRVGRVEFHLHESGDRLALRVRDPDSPIRVGFAGPRWFPVSDQAPCRGDAEAIRRATGRRRAEHSRRQRAVFLAGPTAVRLGGPDGACAGVLVDARGGCS